MYGYIYKTTNLVTGKIYVGQKKSSKFLGESYLGSGKRLNSSIQHYGDENFKVELIEECSSREELNLREIYWIDKLNSRDLAVGYNIAKGGDGTDGAPIWNKGLTKEMDSRLCQSQAEREKRAKSLHRAHQRGKFDYDKMFSPEVRAKMSAKAKLRPHPPTTAGRICYTDGIQNKMLKPEQIADYESMGWYKGKTFKNKKDPWNKGLTKFDDERLMNNSTNRKKLIQETGGVGFCKLKENKTL